MTDEVDEWTDHRLASWAQGDCVLGDEAFVHVIRDAPDPSRPRSLFAPLARAGRFIAARFRYLGGRLAPLIADAGGRTSAQKPMPVRITPVSGLAVLTQTCDVVRACGERPFVEVAPLVHVDADSLRQIERMRRPRYAYVPAVASHGLVADLDRVMTVEKAVVAGWDRIAGCRDDGDRRRFRDALVRKRARAAFPDDFVDVVRPLESRLEGKHDKSSPEGRALRALREIRVRAAPEWDAAQVQLFFWFIRHDDDAGPSFDDVDRWLALLKSGGRFEIAGELATLGDLSGRDYVESDPLDLEHLSSRSR